MICLGFLLDIGNIKEPTDSQYRKNLICSLYDQDQWGKEPEMQKELRGMGEFYSKELIRLKKYLEDKEAIRIWYSDAPYSRCGFYSLCTMLADYDNEIYSVKLPEYEVHQNYIVSFKNWGEVAAEEFAGFLSYEKKVSKEEIKMYAGKWRELAEENSPLRTVISGRLIGVSEDFYDFLIWKYLDEKPIKEARLIGDILVSSGLSVGDWWYAKRIEYWISRGKIQVVRDLENKYARIIRRIV